MRLDDYIPREKITLWRLRVAVVSVALIIAGWVMNERDIEIAALPLFVGAAGLLMAKWKFGTAIEFSSDLGWEFRRHRAAYTGLAVAIVAIGLMIVFAALSGT